MIRTFARAVRLRGARPDRTDTSALDTLPVSGENKGVAFLPTGFSKRVNHPSGGDTGGNIYFASQEKNTMLFVRRLFTLLSLCAVSLALAVPAARGQGSTLSDFYTIIYKDLNSSIQPVIGASSITIADPTAMGSLKIVKKKGVQTYPRIDLIATSGTLTQVLTQGNVLELRATGDILDVTSTKAHLHTIRAREIGSVKMADFARSHSTYGSEVLRTSLYARGNLPTGFAAAPPTLSSRKLVVNLSGVGLVDCIAPTQEAQIKLTSKSWVNSQKVKDVSVANIPRVAVTPTSGNGILVGHLSLLSVCGGGSAYGQSGSICPLYIQCYGLANTPSKIIGKGMVFTFTSHFTLGRTSTHTYKEIYNGTVFPGAIYSGAAKLDIQAISGDVRATTEIRVKGSVGKIIAQVKRMISKSPGYPASIWLVGGYYSVPLLQTGASTSPTLAAAAGPTDIGLIKADLGLNWDLTWGGSSYVPTPHPDYTIRAGLDGKGKIGILQSLKAGSKSLGESMLEAGGPYICGAGYAATAGVIKGGVYDGYFTWHPIE